MIIHWPGILTSSAILEIISLVDHHLIKDIYIYIYICIYIYYVNIYMYIYTYVLSCTVAFVYVRMVLYIEYIRVDNRDLS